MSAPADYIIFGGTHVGIRLAERLVERGGRVRLIAPSFPVRQTEPRWEQVCSDYLLPAGLGEARLVYVVTDQDKLNIRLVLAVSRQCPGTRIVGALTNTRLGERLQEQLKNFSFVNPPELAAGRFVEALYASRLKPLKAPAVSTAVPEEPDRWRPDPLILRAVAVIALIGILATWYFHEAENLRWIDSVYFVVTMMATVGFGDISLRDSSTLSKIVGIAVMVASVVNTAVVFALITDSLLKKRLVLSFGRRRMRASGHIVVVGVGTVGLRVVEELMKRGESVVVIESQENGRNMPAIYAKRIPALLGDARTERVLRDVGLLRAKALLSMTSDDLINLEIGLNARLLRPELRLVLRIFDQELAGALREQLDIHFAFSMSAIAAEALARFAEPAAITGAANLSLHPQTPE